MSVLDRHMSSEKKLKIWWPTDGNGKFVAHANCRIRSHATAVHYISITDKTAKSDHLSDMSTSALYCCYCAEEDPSSYELIQDAVRPHLASMIRDSVMTKFPFQQHCYCNGQAGGRMLACDRCDRWFVIFYSRAFNNRMPVLCSN